MRFRLMRLDAPEGDRGEQRRRGSRRPAKRVGARTATAMRGPERRFEMAHHAAVIDGDRRRFCASREERKRKPAHARRKLRRVASNERAHRVLRIRSRRPMIATVLPRLNMFNMLKKNMSFSMMKTQGLCTLPCTPVSWRALCARASVVRGERERR